MPAQYQGQPQAQPQQPMYGNAQRGPEPAGFVERRPVDNSNAGVQQPRTPVNPRPADNGAYGRNAYDNRNSYDRAPAPGVDMFEEEKSSGKSYADPNKGKSLFSSFKLENTVSSGLLVAALYALLAFVGYKAAFILLAVIWFVDKRDDKWLRQNSIKAFIVVVCFDLLHAFVNVIPSFLGWVNSFLELTYDQINLSTMNAIFDLLSRVISYAQFVVLIVLILRSLFKKSIWFGPADGIINKHVR